MGLSDASSWSIVLIGAAVLVLLRLLVNFLPGKTPPIFEGIPYIGGILKFSKVVYFSLLFYRTLHR